MHAPGDVLCMCVVTYRTTVTNDTKLSVAGSRLAVTHASTGDTLNDVRLGPHGNGHGFGLNKARLWLCTDMLGGRMDGNNLSHRLHRLFV
jgi:hypothetical protein